MDGPFKLLKPDSPKRGPQKLIINLSKSLILTKDQTSVLEKGLSFIPTPPKCLKKELLADIQSYHRRIKLETYFEGKKNSKEKVPFTHPSDWEPPLSSLPKEIGKVIRADNYAFKSLHWGIGRTPNLTTGEKRALKELRDNTNIVIKPADKGNATVILDRAHYIGEGLRQLSVRDHYHPLEGPVYLETAKEVENILEDMVQKRVINGKQKKYLMGEGPPRPRLFYLLPKIHKEPAKWSIPFVVPPGRPIVSDCNSETYCTAEYIEHFLNPLSTRHPSYLKDTYDFISKIGKLKIPSNSFLFTIDIDSLYTNIDTPTGITAVQNCMKKYPDPHRPDEHLLKLLEINLTKNDFEFDSKFYLQVKGTAMGKKFAPSYANIFMADWEQTALATSALKPLAYFRFLDDIWGVWTHSMEDFLVFISHLNAHQESISVKYSIDRSEVNFLDVVSYKGPRFTETGHLDFKVYFKETDTHSLLHRDSFHPKHTFRGIIKSQLLRFKRICSQPSSFREATRTLFQALRCRGYGRSFLKKILKKFDEPKKPQAEETQNRHKIIPLTALYSSQCVSLNLAIKENFLKFLGPTKFLQHHRPIAAYKRNTNLKDVLVRSKLNTLKPQSRVGRCKYFVQTRWVMSRYNKKIFKIPRPLTHETSNCIYLVFCVRCRRQYVGQTKNELRVRAYQHAHNIMHGIDKRRYLVQHFLAHGLSSLKVTALQSNPAWSLKERLRAESTWIKRLDTVHPRGLNEA